MNNCYSHHLQLQNMGGLTLINDFFFSFGKSLMEKIRSNINYKRIEERTNSLYEIGLEALMSDNGLYEMQASTI